MEDLKQKAFSGVIWSYINKFGTQILSIVPSMVLARLITPSEFGLVAIAGVFSGLAYIIGDGGFGTALVQRKDADDLDYCSVFYCNIALSTLVYFCFFFSAPAIASLLDQPRVVGIIRISLLGLIANSFGAIHSAIFKKAINFKQPAYRNLMVQATAACVAIVMAIMGCGYWTLVVQGLLQTTLGSIANWMMCPWRPKLCFSWARVKRLFGFGSKMFGGMLIDYSFSKSYDLIIGKIFSPASLSFYNRAYSSVNLFVDSIMGVLNSVAIPVFSAIQDDKQRTIYNLRRFMRIDNMLVCALIATMCASAEPFFHFMYSSKWDYAIPYFRLLCLWGAIKPMKLILESVLIANGQSSAFLLNNIINKILVVAVICITWHMGIVYMIGGQILTLIAEVGVLTYFSKRTFNYGLRGLLADFLPFAVKGVAVGAGVWGVTIGLNQIVSNIPINEFFSSLIVFGISFGCGIIAFLLIHKWLQDKSYQDLIGIIDSSTSNSAIKRIIRICK